VADSQGDATEPPKPAMREFLRGHFLIAGCRLKDPNFFKTAVLLVEHNDDGAMGLVVNRPSSVTVSNALAGHFDLPETGELVYVGGPVEPAALFVLHSSPALDGGERPVVEGLYVGTNTEIFERVVQSSGDDEHLQFRVFSGCAGWAPGQLEGELARGDWFTHPACAEAVFEEDPYSLWDVLLGRVYQSHRLLPHRCEHPEWN
jgi:putative transcriptional regulator